MGTLSAEQWGCQAWLLLSKSSSRAHWGARILQSNRRLLLEPAGDVMQLVGKGGQPIRCGPWPVSPVACRRVAWQQQAEQLGQRSFRTLSGPKDGRTWDWFLGAQEPVCSGKSKPWGLLESCIVEAEAHMNATPILALISSWRHMPPGKLTCPYANLWVHF